MDKHITAIHLEREHSDAEHFYTVGWCPELGIYVMAVLVPWIMQYNRYYRITEEEYELCRSDSGSFRSRLFREVGQRLDCFTERMIGSQALRDYDARDGFQNSQAGRGNPFRGYLWRDGIMYAEIRWNGRIIYVPPVQALLSGGDVFYPLEKNCVMEKNSEGEGVCYRLITDQENPPESG